MKIAGVIVNYKTADLAWDAAVALAAQLQPYGGRVVIVDNDSRDGSAEQLRERAAPPIELVCSSHNGGFGFGNNVGARWLLESDDPPEYIYFLNPDAIPDEGAVDHLVRRLDGTPEAGIVGTAVHGGDGRIRPTAFRFPTVLSELEAGLRIGPVSKWLGRWVVAPPPPSAAGPVDWVTGASFAVRAETLQQLGLFDEAFFLYFEEVDLCWRAAEAGWQVYYEPRAKVAHVGSVSTGLSQAKRRPAYWFESRWRFFNKHYGLAYATAASATWALAFSTWRVQRRLRGKPDPDPPQLLQDFLRSNARLCWQECRRSLSPET